MIKRTTDDIKTDMTLSGKAQKYLGGSMRKNNGNKKKLRLLGNLSPC